MTDEHAKMISSTLESLGNALVELANRADRDLETASTVLRDLATTGTTPEGTSADLRVYAATELGNLGTKTIDKLGETMTEYGKIITAVSKL